jgi:class 3 adenylate cyclase/outer membrane biosynthesis protein TonB
VFIDLVGYSKKPVTEQIRLKTSLTNNLSEAIKDIPVNDRIILDTGDGAAISFLGDPEDALFVTLSLREAIVRDNTSATSAEASGEDSVRMGINLGPVKLVKDINGHPNIIGDGINVAQRIMSFARPGQIVVSRSYYDVVSNLAGEYAKLFSYEGSRTDKHVREHEIYVVGHHEGALQKAKDGMRDRASSTTPNQAARRTGTHGGAAISTLTLTMPAFVQDRKKLTMVAGGLALVVLILGILVATKKPSTPDGLVASVPASTEMAAAPAKPLIVPAPSEPIKPAAAAAATEPAKPDAKVLEQKPAASQVPEPAPAKADAPKPAEPPKAEAAKTDAASAEAAKALTASAAPPATLVFSVQPWGEIFVDGKSRGVTPPMKSLKLPPGKYKLEVRNTTFPVHAESLDLKTRDEITVRHRFQ